MKKKSREVHIKYVYGLGDEDVDISMVEACVYSVAIENVVTKLKL